MSNCPASPNSLNETREGPDTFLVPMASPLRPPFWPKRPVETNSGRWRAGVAKAFPRKMQIPILPGYDRQNTTRKNNLSISFSVEFLRAGRADFRLFYGIILSRELSFFRGNYHGSGAGNFLVLHIIFRLREIPKALWLHKKLPMDFGFSNQRAGFFAKCVRTP